MGGWPSKATPASSASGWSSLLPELSDLILRSLPSLADRVRFASVCRHWRHAVKHYSLQAASLPRALPWLNFRSGRFRSLPDGELHSFRFRKYTLCFGCFDNWLLFEEAGCRPSRRYYLQNPLITGATKRLPGYCMEPVHLNPDGSHGTSSSSRSTEFYISKVIMCSRDLVVAKLNYQHRPDAVVCCRPGMSSTWLTGLCNGNWYHDMAFYEGKLYTVTVEGDLFVNEVSNGTGTEEPRVSRMEQLIQGTPNSATRCYLVISRTSKLLLVRWIIPQDSTQEMTMKVLEADLKMSRWLEVESLGDQVLFISSYCSKAVTASSHGGYLQGNQIYFLDDGLVHWFLGPCGNRQACGVFHMSSNTIHPISLGEEHLSTQSKASWFFP
ncbi:unnamed protein product [Urochloa decumbens]|uniref:KIB1-4 beta-propeller domain-containing protein n=1 Tax=Urochloa decumbens TaxID=240449 RepID=A0ABC9CIK3_9POAL